MAGFPHLLFTTLFKNLCITAAAFLIVEWSDFSPEPSTVCSTYFYQMYYKVPDLSTHSPEPTVPATVLNKNI